MIKKCSIYRGGSLQAVALAALLHVGAMMLPGATQSARAETAAPSEYSIKAAFLYKFLFFLTWPEGVRADTDPVVLGIVGKDPFDDAFEGVENKPCGPGNRVLRIRRMGSYHASQGLADCHLLFICDSDKAAVPEILRRIAGRPVLSIAEHPGFLEAGGMVNLVIRDRKVRWEINQTAIQRAGLRAQAQLLRNAVRVFEPPGDER
jgi:hypothetical protein